MTCQQIKNHRGLFKYFLLLLLAGSLNSCLSEVTLEVPKNDNQSIAIRGSLLAGTPSIIRVEITNLSDFVVSDVPEAIVGASVVLIDEQNNGVDVPMTSDGVYELTIPDDVYPLKVKTGKSYQLSVATPNGSNYLSTLEPLHAVPIPTAIEPTIIKREIINEAGNIVEQEFFNFLLSSPIVTPDNSEKSYLKWDLIGTYKLKESAIEGAAIPNDKTCYIFENLNLDKVVTLNGPESSQNNIVGFPLLEEALDYRFIEGFYLTAFQQSLSEGAYKYWNEIGKVVELSGNFFEAPPGKVLGNFRNVNREDEEVFGYFYATQQELFRIYIPPVADRVMRFCPLVTPNKDAVEAVCTECLLRVGSTLIKPDFWED